MAMQDLRKALADIDAIRDQVARATVFRGYGPATTALTAVLAALAAGLQALWLASPREQIGAYLTIWIGAAVLATTLIGVETVTRSRRLHSRLADEMIYAAIEQLIPVAIAGVLVTFVLMRFAPQTAWMLPGLWQILFSLGLFASRQLLPKALFAPAAWYLTTGLVCLAVPSTDGDLSPAAFSPWAMGVPFGIGQLMLAGVLYRALGDGASGE
jgi:hypothetical protein